MEVVQFSRSLHTAIGEMLDHRDLLEEGTIVPFGSADRASSTNSSRRAAAPSAAANYPFSHSVSNHHQHSQSLLNQPSSPLDAAGLPAAFLLFDKRAKHASHTRDHAARHGGTAIDVACSPHQSVATLPHSADRKPLPHCRSFRVSPLVVCWRKLLELAMLGRALGHVLERTVAVSGLYRQLARSRLLGPKPMMAKGLPF
ncbi:hypothetical protein CLOM_g15198 [Closterium sp. NIES-68]|nr:hypothetical protein CLOM_g15198 [Closterium sp. NIES-68]GJP78799.1 hypothetical protein CLOP_g9071 [Closterium sp. NIES-67]